MNGAVVLARKAGVEDVDIDGEILLYDGIRLQLLPGAATAIWRQLDGHRTAVEIAGALAPSPADAEQVERDVLAFLSQLVDQGLVEPGTGPAHAVARHVGWVRDAGGVLIVDMRSGRRHALTPTGSRIWEIACEGATTPEIVEALQVEFPDAPASLPADVETLLDQLGAEGLLLRHDGGGVAPSSA